MKPKHLIILIPSCVVGIMLLPFLPWGPFLAIPCFLIFPWLISETRLHRQFKRELEMVLEAHRDDLDADS